MKKVILTKKLKRIHSLRCSNFKLSSTKSKDSKTFAHGNHDAYDLKEESLSGYEDLKKFLHKSNDFLRDVTVLFLERAKLEQAFADGLQKFSSKARKICGDAVIGTLKTSWEELAVQTDEEANLHKSMSSNIIEEIIKPLRLFADSQKEARKNTELIVDKSSKCLTEKRYKELQSKKSAYNKAKESENLTMQIESARGKTMSDKDLSKLDSKCKKAEENVTKSDNEYIARLIAGERARLNLDASINNAAKVFERLEEEKIDYFKNTLKNYLNLLNSSVPNIAQCYDTVLSSVEDISIPHDIQLLINTRGTKKLPGEQLIFTCYEEDFNNTMESARRKLALESKHQRLKKCLIAEKKAKRGLSNLSSVYSDTPSFSNESGQQDVTHQLQHASSVIDLLEISMYRIGQSLSKLGLSSPPAHRLASYISETKDKQGMTSCILCVPVDIDTVSYTDSEYDEDEYMMATTYNETYSELSLGSDDDDDDEFDDVGGEFEHAVSSQPPGYAAIDMCQVDYEYIGQESDELTICPGEQINIILRHDDGWWKGELRGRQGLFPASYVHELK